MKNKFIYGVLLCVSLFMTATLSACSSDDDDTLSGAEQVEQIRSFVNSLSCYALTGDDNIYYSPVADSNEANSMVEKVILTSWDGKSKTVTLNDEYGTLRAAPCTESGQFAKVVINLTGRTPITLIFVSQEYIKGENAIIVSPPQSM